MTENFFYYLFLQDIPKDADAATDADMCKSITGCTITSVGSCQDLMVRGEKHQCPLQLDWDSVWWWTFLGGEHQLHRDMGWDTVSARAHKKKTLSE